LTCKVEGRSRPKTAETSKIILLHWIYRMNHREIIEEKITTSDNVTLCKLGKSGTSGGKAPKSICHLCPSTFKSLVLDDAQ
jgi:hypothetical protein